MGLLQNLGNVILKPITYAGNTITSGLERVTGRTYGRTTAKEAASTTFGKVLTAGIIGTSAGIAGALAPAFTAKAASVAVPVAVLAPKTAEKVTSNPEVLEVALATAINPVAGIVVGLEKGTSLISEAAQPAVQSVKDFTSQISPEVKTAALGVGVTAAAAAITIPQIKKMIAESKAEPIPLNVGSIGNQGVPAVAPQEVTTTGNLNPITPKIEAQGVPVKKATKKRRSKPRTTHISQRVNVIVSQKQTNKRYLNKIYV